MDEKHTLKAVAPAKEKEEKESAPLKGAAPAKEKEKEKESAALEAAAPAKEKEKEKESAALKAGEKAEKALLAELARAAKVALLPSDSVATWEAQQATSLLKKESAKETRNSLLNWLPEETLKAPSTYGEAICLLAGVYERGATDKRPDGDKALELYREAAALQNEHAQRALGRLYADGGLVEKDEKAALSWLKRAADAGDMRAKVEQGLLAEFGLKDIPMASELYQAVCRLEGEEHAPLVSLAFYRRALLLEAESKEWARDFVECALSSFAYPPALYYKGECLLAQGRKTEAAEYFRRASGKGHLQAQYRFAERYGDAKELKDAALRGCVPALHLDGDLLSAAETGYAPAQFALSQRPDTKDKDLFLEKAAEQGHPAALFLRALSSDPVDRLRMSAAAGFAPAQLALSFYHKESGNQEKSQRCLEKGLLTGPQDVLAHCYQEGLFVDKDELKAIEFYQKVGGADNLYKAGMLAKKLEMGEKASELFKLAVAQKEDFKEAHFELGNCYKDEQDYLSAADSWREAANYGHLGASYALACAYFAGEGAPRDEKKAFAMLSVLVQSGYFLACYELGRCHYEGRGVIQIDRKRGFDLWMQGAEKGDPDCQNKVGVSFLNGLFVEHNADTAFLWLKKAADQGSSNAQYNLAICYLEGKGAPQSLEKAVSLCRLATDERNSATLMLGYFHEHGVGVEQDSKQAFAYYKEAADSFELKVADEEDLVAKFKLAQCYYTGVGVLKDRQRGRDLFSDIAYKCPLALQWLEETLDPRSAPAALPYDERLVLNAAAKLKEDAAEKFRKEDAATESTEGWEACVAAAAAGDKEALFALAVVDYFGPDISDHMLDAAAAAGHEGARLLRALHAKHRIYLQLLV